jgi:hypothetical protein
MEIVVQDSPGTGQVSDRFYGVGVDDNLWAGIVSLGFISNSNLFLSAPLLLQ